MGCETSYLGTGICIGGFCICVGGKKSSSEKKPAEAKGKTEKLSLPETGKPAEKSVKKPSNDCFGKTSKAYLGVPYPSCEVMSPMETPLLHLPSLEIDSRLLLQTNPRLPKVILLDPAPFDPGKNPKSWSDYLLERYRPFYLR